MYAYHFLPIAAPAALVLGLVPRVATPRSVAFAVLLPALLSVQSAMQMIGSGDDRSRLSTSDAVASLARPGDRVWSDNVARLALETGLPVGSRIPLTFLFINTDDAPIRYSKMLLDDLNHLKPAVVVLPADVESFVDHFIKYNRELAAFDQRARNYRLAWIAIRENVERDYSLVTTLDRESVFRRRSANDTGHITSVRQID
jgi:hypothetical protein